MQSTGYLNHIVVVAGQGIAEHLLHDPATLHARNHMLHDDSDAGDQPVASFLLLREFPAAWLFLGLVEVHAFHFVALKPGIAVSIAAFRQAGALLITDFLVVLLALVGSAQPLDLPVFEADDQVVLQGVAFFLPL